MRPSLSPISPPIQHFKEPSIATSFICSTRLGAVSANGASQIDARDGALSLVRRCGLQACSPEVVRQMRAGRPTDTASACLRGTPGTDVLPGPHGGLNNQLFAGTRACQTDGIQQQAFLVE